MKWSDQIDERFKALYVERYSFNQIAQKLSAEFGVPCTKNAAIGRSHRLKLPERGSTQAGTSEAKRQTAAGRAARGGGKIVVDAKVSKRGRGMQGLAFKLAHARKDGVTNLADGMERVLGHTNVAPIHTGEEVGRRVSLEKLKHNQCKWPNGDPRERDFGFCGDVAEKGKPYCPYHTKKAKGGNYNPFAPGTTDPSAVMG